MLIRSGPRLWSGAWEFGHSDVDEEEEVLQRTAGLGGKPVLDASFTGSSQLSCELINEAMAAPGGWLRASFDRDPSRDRPLTGFPSTWSDLP